MDRVPTLISNGLLAANAVEYYPVFAGDKGQDRFGNTILVRYVSSYAWADKAGTLVLEESDDRSSWSTTSTTSVTASTATRVGWTALTKRFWRWKYTNGADAQTEFRLYEDKTPDLQNTVAYGNNGGTLVPLKASSDGTLASSTTATATFNDKHEVLITRQTDFLGKTAGQTYDVPHVSKSAARTTFDAPSSFASEIGTYSGIVLQDASVLTTSNSTNGNYTQHLFSFDLLTIAKRTAGIPSNWTVSDFTTNCKSVTVTWVGYGVGSNGGISTNGAQLKVWRTDTSAWDLLNQHTASTPTALNGTWSNSAIRVDTSGFVHLLAHSTYASDGAIASTIYTDYIRVEMTLLGSRLNEVEAHTRNAVLQGGATATGNGTTMSVENLSTVVFNVRGTFSGTVTFEGSLDDTNWDSLLTTTMGSGVIGTTATSTGLYRASVTGLKSIRARVSSYTSGTIYVTARGTAQDAATKSVQATSRLYNGSTYEDERSNTEGTLLASAARTATTYSSDQTSHNHRGVLMILNVTANPGAAETLTVSLEAKDSISSGYRSITAFATVSATNARYAFVVYPGAVETTDNTSTQTQGLPVPRTWRAGVTHSAAGSWTYSLSVAGIL